MWSKNRIYSRVSWKHLLREIKVIFFSLTRCTCKATNLTIVHECTNFTLRDNLGDNANIRAVKIENQEIAYLPLNLGEIFPNLRVVKVKKSKLEAIGKKYLLNMPNVEVLDLPSNLIERVAAHAFSQLPKLRELDISRNRLKSLHSETFSNNINLIDIDARYNKIEGIGSKLFKNNGKLKSIDFSNNKISTVDFRFDERFTSVDLYLFKNTCFDQIFIIDAEQSFNKVNKMLAKNCSESESDVDYQSLFDDEWRVN